MFNALIITTGIAWGGFAPGTIVYENPEEEAIKALGKATYYYLEIDEDVKRLENRIIPKEFKKYGFWPIFIIKSVSEQRVSYEWTF